MSTWRQGRSVPHHVYRQTGAEPDTRPWPDGDQPIATFMDPGDAELAVRAVESERKRMIKTDRERLGYRAGFSDGVRYARDIDAVTARIPDRDRDGQPIPEWERELLAQQPPVETILVPTTDADVATVGIRALRSRPFPDARWDTRTEAWEREPYRKPDGCTCPGPICRNDRAYGTER